MATILIKHLAAMVYLMGSAMVMTFTAVNHGILPGLTLEAAYIRVLFVWVCLNGFAVVLLYWVWFVISDIIRLAKK